MSQLVLYLLAQAVGTLGFAYLIGTIALQRRAVPCAVIAAGMYMMLGSALVQIGADRLGWSAASLAAAYALVTGGVGLLGAGSLLRRRRGDVPSRWERPAGLAVLAASVVCAIALVALRGALVDDDGLRALPFGDGWSRLAPAGWALGAPLALGAAALVVTGARDVLEDRRWKGAYVWAAGVAFAAWPFDFKLEGVPLMPLVMLLGMALVYLAIAPKGKRAPDGVVEREGPAPAPDASVTAENAGP